MNLIMTTLNAGRRLGPYEIVGPLGAGGMGEVYRAKDTRLQRTVAIKVLPLHLSDNPDLKQRFEREARAISGLSHPHICALYDVGHQDGVDYLVMEYLEGETLAQRLSKGPLPAEQALRSGIEIAGALNTAHREKIVHRDLKPGNIMMTRSGAKLLDFGLAKLGGQPVGQAGDGVSALQTEAKDLTTEGTILGTIQYMSPEQLEGSEVDARSDIFSLGSVLYEMATGKKAFTAKSQASLISAILKDDPAPVSQMQPLAPAALDHVIKKCLAKDPEERWQNAYDVASELKWIAEGSAQSVSIPAGKTRNGRERFWMAISAALLLTAISFAFLYLRRSQAAPDAPLVRFTIPPPKDSTFQGTIALSPDGKKLAFVAADASGRSLWIRALDSTESRRMPDTDDASFPFWSPDSRLIAYFAHGKLRKMDSSGGTSQFIVDAPDARGGSWGSKGTIVFSPNSTSGIFRVSPEGGTVERQTTNSGLSSRWPVFLPDGLHFMYVSRGGELDTGVFAASLDSKQSSKLLPIISRVAYAPPGYLIYIDQGSLMCRRFDTNRMAFQGDAVPLAPQPWVDFLIFGSSGFSVSSNGVLAYREGGNQFGQFTWYDRAGTKLGTVGPPLRATEPYLSPDESHVLFYQWENVVGLSDEWLLDLSSGRLSRFTFDPSDDNTSAWSRDGSRIVWSSIRSGWYELYQKSANGAGTDEPLLVDHTTKFPDNFSPDGRYLLYDLYSSSGADLWVLPMTGDKKPFPYLQTAANEAHGCFSPDGRWIAYTSDESGKTEIYVQGFPATSGGKWQVSTAGGDQPQWRKDGKELFYVAPDQTLVSVEVRSSQSGFSSGTPKTLFHATIHSGITTTRNDYLVTADGQRFLINTPLEDTARLPITVVLNWTNLLKQ